MQNQLNYHLPLEHYSPNCSSWRKRKDGFMEKISINGIQLSLLPMGINKADKTRSFTVSTDLANDKILAVISDVSTIEHISEGGEILDTYLDGVKANSVTNHLDGTYTIEISIDAIERQLTDLRAEIAVLKAK